MWWRSIVISLIVLGIIFINLKRDRVVICDVGQGNGAILISGQTQVLVDTGPPGGAMVKCLEKNLPIWDKKIEGIIISHGDSDHSGGLPELQKYYQVEQIYSSDKLRRNDVLRFGKYEVDVVWPEKISGESNTDSVVLKVNNGKKLFWFLGDITSDVEQYLSWRNLWGGSGGMLIASHHGSKSATTSEMLNILKPEEVIISVGKNNKFGHPDKEVLERLQGIKVIRTDINGEIIFD